MTSKPSNFEVWTDLLTPDHLKLSKEKLSEKLTAYNKKLDNLVTMLKAEPEHTLDLFNRMENALGEESLLSFTINKKQYNLMLSHYSNDQPNGSADSCYLLETRNRDKDHDANTKTKTYHAGEEDQLLETLHELGLPNVLNDDGFADHLIVYRY